MIIQIGLSEHLRERNPMQSAGAVTICNVIFKLLMHMTERNNKKSLNNETRVHTAHNGLLHEATTAYCRHKRLLLLHVFF